MIVVVVMIIPIPISWFITHIYWMIHSYHNIIIVLQWKSSMMLFVTIFHRVMSILRLPPPLPTVLRIRLRLRIRIRIRLPTTVYVIDHCRSYIHNHQRNGYSLNDSINNYYIISHHYRWQTSRKYLRRRRQMIITTIRIMKLLVTGHKMTKRRQYYNQGRRTTVTATALHTVTLAERLPVRIIIPLPPRLHMRRLMQ